MSDDLFTAQEAADFLKVKKTTVYELVKRGDLPSTKIGKQLRIPRAALEGMTGAAHSQPSAKPPLREGGRAGVILCGQDSSLDLIANQVTASAGNGAVVLRSHAGSYNSLTMLYHGKVDLATAHLWDEKSGTYNLPYIEKLLPGIEVTVVRLFGRTTGLYVPAGNPKGVEGISALTRSDLVMVNRERGSGVRVLVDEKRKAMGLSPRQIRGYDDERTSHITVAAAVAGGPADYGFGSRRPPPDRWMGWTFSPSSWSGTIWCCPPRGGMSLPSGRCWTLSHRPSSAGSWPGRALRPVPDRENI